MFGQTKLSEQRDNLNNIAEKVNKKYNSSVQALGQPVHTTQIESKINEIAEVLVSTIRGSRSMVENARLIAELKNKI